MNRSLVTSVDPQARAVETISRSAGSPWKSESAAAADAISGEIGTNSTRGRARARRECRGGSSVGVPALVERRHQILLTQDTAAQRPGLFEGQDPGDGLAALGHDQGLAGRRDFVEE